MNNEWADEWMKAAGRITHFDGGAHGGREMSALAWLVDFAQITLSELSAGQRADKTREVERFSFDAGLVHTVDNLQSEAIMIKGNMIGVDAVEGGPIVLEDLQKATRAALDAFVTGGVSTFQNISGHISAHRAKVGGFRGVSFSGPFTSCFYFVASQLLSRRGDRIRRCKGCARLAIMGRRDKQFCTQVCQVAAWKREHSKQSKKPKAKKGASSHGTKRRTR